jgi:hypothetical protein
LAPEILGSTMKLAMTAAGAALAALLAGDAVAQAVQRDRLLEQSGFIMRSADTPQKIARMKRIPSYRFVARNGPSGRYYMYADPVLCVCVFVGNEQAMSNYKSQVMQVPVSELAPTQAAPAAPPSPFKEIHEVDEDVFGRPVDEDILEYRY